MNRQMRRWQKWAFLTAVIFLSGCASDQTRQSALCAALAKQYQFQQQPASAMVPAQFIVCGNPKVPCLPVTSIERGQQFKSGVFRPKPLHHHLTRLPVKSFSHSSVKSSQRKCVCHCV